jgi:hypothetical protein
MKKLLIALLVLGTTQFALAAATPITKIKDIYVYADYIVLKMENKHTNPDACTKATSDEFLYLATNSEGGKKMYSAALSAYVAGKKVRLGYSSCASWGSTTVPKAYGISLYK